MKDVMESVFKMNDAAKARAYFETKLAFTTGPVELDHALTEGEKINVVDVRDHDDFVAGHIPGAIHLPKDKWDRPEGLCQDRINVIYCYSQACHLAATAALRFATLGFPVMELEGGFDGWKKLDLEIEREHVNRLKKATGLVFHHRRS
jgi:rhodanese-related sulfurtransferase